MRFSNDQISSAYTEYLDALDYDEELVARPDQAGDSHDLPGDQPRAESPPQPH